ncbi:dolichol kinase [Prochlorococcus sp. MIT 1307]|uniref:diacylglycerol/polyprenol kinase family protein n=1 Tax=Prochlorococcus sp. MIT 1307 TaxID=3096219 RepID=UPI002A751163|nr:dolichol kinase [Prochlorococcus sp. MIT 1307]
MLGNANSIVIIIGWICTVLLGAAICRNSFPNQKELSRKIVHIGTGPVIPLAWFLGISAELAIPVAIIITIALIINHRIRLLPALEDVNRQSYGTIAYGISISFLLILLWPDHAAAVTAGVLMMSFGDGLAGLIGRQVNSSNWIIFGQRKSLAGTLTMGLTGIIVLLLIMTFSASVISPLSILLIAGLAMGLEQISPLGIDNLTVPIGVAYGWLWLSN